MDKLQDLSQSELEELLDNAERVEIMALESDEIQNLQLEREMALASNRSLAEQNLDMKPRLQEERDRLVERYAQLESVRETYRQHCALRDGMVGQVSPEGLFTRLQTEGANTETESESLAEDFLDGSVPLDCFLERFLSLRSLAHQRRVRIEKLQDILRQRSQPAAHAATPPAQPANQDPQAGGAATPSPWTHQTHHHQQQPPAPASQPANHSSFQNATPNAAAAAGPALPYTPYPVAPPIQAAAPPPSSGGPGTGPAKPPPQFPPYPVPGASFTPSAGYAFRGSALPYPAQPAFPGGGGGSAFGQYAPPPGSGAPPPYPTGHPYGAAGYGYSYSYPTGPALPSAQSPSGGNSYRPGYGVPQPYS